MGSLLNVQRAARRLGVSPITVRRWTASGFLPCTRTQGGHRRFRTEDVDELAQLIRGSNPLAARRARERELETLLGTSIALVSQLELPDLLKEIAKQLTRLMDCHFCAISAVDEQAQVVTMLADYDDSGQRLPNLERYHLSRFPLTRKVLEERVPAVVNVSDPAADVDEVRELLREGDKSLLMVPLVYGGRATGLLELIDHRRERRYSQQELRLCTAIAGQAAVAIHNAEAFSAARRGEDAERALESALGEARRGAARLEQLGATEAVLQEAADVALRMAGAVTCVAHYAGASAGAIGRQARHSISASAQQSGTSAGVARYAHSPATDETDDAASRARHAAQVSQAQLVVVADPRTEQRPAESLTFTLSLARPPHTAELELLTLWAALVGARLDRCNPASGSSTSLAQP